MDSTEVEVGLGYTVNTGNFESLRVDVRVRDFVRQSDKNTRAAIERVSSLVEDALSDKVAEVRETFKA